MKEMIYDFSIHSLYYNVQDINVPNFSLAIDTLEMVFELETGKLLGIQGFFPLIQASKSNIYIPECKKVNFLLHNFDLSMCKQNEIYNLVEKIPQTKKYFENISTKYDKDKGIIQIGENIKEQENIIEVNDNILCGIDRKMYLKCVYIIPTRFIYI